MTARRTIVLGLELGDGKLLHAWAQQGKLPYLQRLIEQGSWGWLETSADQLHISAWPTIYTGVGPGEHGVYFTFQPAPGLQGYQRFHQGLYGKPTFWQLLDQGGVRCNVIDAPYTHPEPGFRGMFIYDWGTWAHYLRSGSTPPSAIRQLTASCGAYPLGLEANDLGFEPLDAGDISQRLAGAVRAKSQAICWMLQQHPAPLLMAVFGETHVAGHYCWPSGVDDDREALNAAPLLAVYQQLDQAVKQIHAAAGPDATLIVISGDRVGPNRAGWHLLPEVLSRLGMLAVPNAAAQAEDPDRPKSKRSLDPVKLLRDLLPVEFRKNLARRLPTALRDKLARRVDTADIDWSRTRVYLLPTDLEGYVRVNLRGREPQGIVAAGAEYEQVLAELSTALHELRDPVSNEPIVAEVIRVDERFPGARRDWLPDLVVCWNNRRAIGAAVSSRIGRIDVPSPDTRHGTHRGPGFVLAHGPGVAPGSQLQGGNILDVAPTLLRRHGIAVPDYMTGRAWNELQAGAAT